MDWGGGLVPQELALRTAVKPTAAGTNRVVGEDSWLLRVPLAEIDFHAPIAHGAFASVFEGRWQGAPVALKRLKTRGMAASAVLSLQEELETEAALLSKEALRHRNIVTFLGLVVDPHGGASMLMTELAHSPQSSDALTAGGCVLVGSARSAPSSQSLVAPRQAAMSEVLLAPSSGTNSTV